MQGTTAMKCFQALLVFQLETPSVASNNFTNAKRSLCRQLSRLTLCQQGISLSLLQALPAFQIQGILVWSLAEGASDIALCMLMLFRAKANC